MTGSWASLPAAPLVTTGGGPCDARGASAGSLVDSEVPPDPTGRRRCPLSAPKPTASWYRSSSIEPVFPPKHVVDAHSTSSGTPDLPGDSRIAACQRLSWLELSESESKHSSADDGGNDSRDPGLAMMREAVTPPDRVHLSEQMATDSARGKSTSADCYNHVSEIPDVFTHGGSPKCTIASMA